MFNGSSGIGWKSWKRRWFILTRTSLVFFKNDPVSLTPILIFQSPSVGAIPLEFFFSMVV